MIHVMVNGACGRMGSEVVRALAEEKDLVLTGAVDPGHAGEDAGKAAGLPANGVVVAGSVKEALAEKKTDVVVDFTNPAVIFENAKAVIGAGVHMVIGTTGLTADQRAELAALSEKTGGHVLIAPNFALGAVLLMDACAKIAKYLPNAEIIELHHENKLDAPSGTAKLTAEKISAARTASPVPDKTTESLPGARGAKYEGIHIHSVRLPGFVAHQEVIFGGHGEILTLRHDSLDRKSFMPGVMLACRKVVSVPGLTYGLENYLD